ncbi:acetate--CoA ligase alpha subunit [Dethiobacter alkaliphilus]|uniref:Acetyl coenzyme A synthetase (ADP forming), alpha domain protein n=1 Tax=Dethiobacter alkaliphilus AHT 1 TaxID=555088 RepID=C0GKL8_DETAL|nr:acetate--CoA ligase [Dethiobacter alkaliphilus]EEG76110.1 acetyl coenzyme A synthetase (ADP forming), alpha domain protein [Dethiobacter alkaliphilus AHT 1]
MSDLHSLFNPDSIAVIGASNNKEKIGFVIMENIQNSGFQGKVYPVNPREKEILGYTCYTSIGKIGQPVDVAVISVPAQLSLDVARECGESGVKFLVVVTAGFKEIGDEGLKREKELLKICRQHKMRMVGPNVVGIMDTHTPANASFAEGFPKQGEIAFISQSGAMLLAIFDWSRSVGLGFSRFVSMGNKADLNEVDFIWSAAQDPNTRVILCYIEDVADGKRFLDVVSEACKKKPVIILKSGTSQAGARAASSHTGALAGSDLAYDTAFRQCGVIRAETMSDLFDLAVAFVSQPIPAGNHVAIVTNSGGPGIIATDSVERNGLRMARFGKDTIETLRNALPAEANLYNPVDVLGDARTDRYSVSLEAVLADENTDCALVLLSPAAVTEPVKTAQVISSLRERFTKKPIFAAYMGGEGLAEGCQVLTNSGVPCFTFPEPALKSFSGMVRFAALQRKLARGQQLPKINNIDQRAVKATFYDVLKERRLVLLGNEATSVAEAYGIPVAPVRLATSPEEAAELADKLGYPAVLKVASPKIMHKTDVGGVKIGLETRDEVMEGYHAIMNSVRRLMPGTPIYGIEVQKMMPKGDELIIGMSRDVQFGPLLAFGLGGIYVNLLKDVSFRLAAGLTLEEIEEMIAETKAYSLIRGYRGSKPADIGALVQTLARVARLSLDFPEITEIDLNPVIAYPDSAVALDVKITVSYDENEV